MNTSPNRRPAGTPTGGQFAPSAHAESTATLDADPSADGVPEAWRAVGVTDANTLGWLQDAGVLPEHFSSPDSDVRRWAAYARGDMIFEGETTGRAYELHEHDSRLDARAVFHQETEVYVGGKTVRWDDLSPEEQVSYIAGCAEAMAENDSIREHRLGIHPGPARQAGRRRGMAINSARSMIDEGRAGDRGFAIVDSAAVGRRLVVTDVEPAPERGGYTAKVAGGQYRRHESDDGVRTVPWSEGAKVFFRAEALGAS